MAIGTSLDIGSLVNAMMTPHQAEVASYTKKISASKVEISDLAKLKTGLSGLHDAMKAVEKNQKSKLTNENLKSALENFTTEYNKAYSTSKTSKDFSIKSTFATLRRDFDPIVANQLGISFDRNGVATFDSNKIDKLIEDEANGIFPSIKKVGSSEFVQTSLNEMVNGFFDKALSSQSPFNKLFDFNGTFATKTRNLEEKVSSLERKKEDKEFQLEDFQAMYTKKFSNLQNMLDQLNAVQSSMTAYTNLLNKQN